MPRLPAFHDRIETLERLFYLVARKQFRDDSRVLCINNIALFKRAQRTQRNILEIPYWRRND